MRQGDLVAISCSGPKEKFWGVLVDLKGVGVTFRGLPIDAFEDWLRQFLRDSPQYLGPTTIFIPTHRIERVEFDESAGTVEGLGARFIRLTGKDARSELMAESQSEPHRLARSTPRKTKNQALSPRDR